MLDILLKLLPGVFDRIFPDKAQADAAKLKLIELQASGELARLAAETDLAKGQIAVNQVEAASTRLFVAGWRPFIGWICGGALAFDTIVKPLAIMVMAYAGHPAPLMPNLTDTQIYGLLFGLLGLGGMRSLEKIKGAA